MALLKGLAGAMIRSEAIETTEPKAKAVRGLIEDLITKARKGSLHDIRQIESIIGDVELVNKLVHQIAPVLKQRNGGYTRLIKMGNRVGDNAPMVRMEFVEKIVKSEPKPEPKAQAAVPAKKTVVKKKVAPKKK